MPQDSAFQPIADPLQAVLRDVANKMIKRGAISAERAAQILNNPNTEPASLRTAGPNRDACPFTSRFEDGAARCP